MTKRAKNVLAIFAAVLVVSTGFFVSANNTPPEGQDQTIEEVDRGGDENITKEENKDSDGEPEIVKEPDEDAPDNQSDDNNEAGAPKPTGDEEENLNTDEDDGGNEITPDPAEECQHNVNVDDVKWSKNETNHWKICPETDCGAKLLKAKHIYEEGNEECTVCGYKKSSESTPVNSVVQNADEQPNGNSDEDNLSAGTHVHDWGDWKSNEDGDTHTRTCETEDCGKTETDDHEYDEKEICTVCGYEKKPESAPLPSVNKIIRKASEQPNVTTFTPTLHEHDWGKWTPNDGKNTHTRTCKTDICGKTETGDHDAKGAEGKCSVCGGFHKHKYDDKHFAWTSDGHQRICTVKGCNETEEFVEHDIPKGKNKCVCGYIKDSGSAAQWESNIANPNLAENLIEQIGKKNNFFGVYYNSNYSTLESGVLAAIKGKNVDLVANDGRVKWDFYGKNINTLKDIDLNVDISPLRGSDNENKISPLVGSANTYVLSFAENGTLPGEVGIRVNMAEIFPSTNQKTFYIYYFDPRINELRFIQKGQVKDGCLHFSIDHNSDYVITDRRIPVNTWNDDDDEEDSESRTTRRFAEVRPNDTGKKENPHTGGY